MKQIQIIPSKSDAHRALICAALSETPCQVICNATSKDIEATKACLGAFQAGQRQMHCGESGSTFRFLLPVMAALGYSCEFLPEGRLPERPLSPLYEEMENHGCKLSPQGTVPFVLEGQLQPGDYHIPGNVSSQYISGLLFALPMLDGDSRILIEGKLESVGYVDMTLKVLADFGIVVRITEEGYEIPGGQSYEGPPVYQVEGDWSNGCFWLVAGALSEEGIKVCGLDLNSLQGDKAIIDLLKQMGADVTIDQEGILIKGGHLHGIEIDASQIPDMVPILAVAALAAEGTTEIKNAGRLRIKESDRLATVSTVLNGLGGQIKELEEGLIITGGRALSGGEVDSYNDHRIAMMAAIASLLCEDKVVIEGADAVNKSYPDFFQVLEEVGLDGNVERK
ncbi:MAG: 3-phosphoshikimate 1-carboxyvinyltransferase [Firmicutes bacterium]|nr:3-phosphoshikimate 1-carboxyvinyltransferase [Bacillota bacterium]